MQTVRKARKNVLSIFLTGFVLMFVALLLQTINELYQARFYIPWIWIFLLYVPLVVFSYRIKETGRMVKTIWLITFSVLFVLTTIAVLISQPLIWSNSELPKYDSYSNTLIRSAIFLIPFVLLILFKIKSIFYKSPSKTEKTVETSTDPLIFISYNHNDRDTAKRIYDTLVKRGHGVIIDKEDMLAGTRIESFIENSIRDSTTTISLVSNRSLQSAWVAMETISTFFHEKFSQQKMFIACYLDDDFFQSGYTLNAINDIDAKIKENQNLIAEYHKKMLDTRDLNDQNSRLLVLRNNLDKIVGKLRESLCLDVSKDSFENSMEQLLRAIEAE